MAQSSGVLFYDGFDGPLNLASWAPMTGWSASTAKSQAYFTPENTYTSGGLLHLLTKRHCVQSGQVPTNSNQNPSGNPCPVGTKKYSAGRLNGNFQTPAGINWEIRVAARLPDNGAPGTRVALWGKNNQQYCDAVQAKTNLGEVDLLEWHPEKANEGDTTTHMSCSGSLAEPPDLRWKTEREVARPQFDDGLWLEWIAQRTGNTISYFLGSGAVGYWPISQDTCTQGEFGFGQAACDAILNDPFHAILQTEVFVDAGYAGHPGPAKQSWFPNQTVLIDWVQISQI